MQMKKTGVWGGWGYALLWLALALATPIAFADVAPAKLEPFSVTDEVGTTRWGYRQREGGKVVVAPRYEVAHDFGSDSYAVVKSAGKEGLVGRDGAEVLPPAFETIYLKGGSLVEIKVEGCVGLLRLGQGVPQVLSDCEYRYIGSYSGDGAIADDDLAPVAAQGKYGYIDRNGKRVIALRFEDAGHFYGDLAQAKENGLWGWIDKQGKWQIPAKYAEVKSDGLQAKAGADQRALVRLGDRWGIIDRAGKTRVDFAWDAIEPSGGADWLAVRRGDLWGFIDSNGVEKIAPQFAGLGHFPDENFDGVLYSSWDRYRLELGWENNSHVAMADGKFGVIDRQGRWLLPPRFANVLPFTVPELTLAKEGGQWGLIDRGGKWKVLPTLTLGEYTLRRDSFWTKDKKTHSRVAFYNTYDLTDIKGETLSLCWMRDASLQMGAACTASVENSWRAEALAERSWKVLVPLALAGWNYDDFGETFAGIGLVGGLFGMSLALLRRRLPLAKRQPPTWWSRLAWASLVAVLSLYFLNIGMGFWDYEYTKEVPPLLSLPSEVRQWLLLAAFTAALGLLLALPAGLWRTGRWLWRKWRPQPASVAVPQA